MKSILSFLLIALTIFAVSAQAQVTGRAFEIKEDSAGVYTWNIGATADFDTSKKFAVSGVELAKYAIQFYWNDADTGDFQCYLQINSLYSKWAADSAYAIDGISSWYLADSVAIVATTGRQTFIWSPTTVKEGEWARLVIGRKTSSGARTVAVVATRRD